MSGRKWSVNSKVTTHSHSATPQPTTFASNNILWSSPTSQKNHSKLAGIMRGLRTNTWGPLSRAKHLFRAHFLHFPGYDRMVFGGQCETEQQLWEEKLFRECYFLRLRNSCKLKGCVALQISLCFHWTGSTYGHSVIKWKKNKFRCLLQCHPWDYLHINLLRKFEQGLDVRAKICKTLHTDSWEE